MHFPVDLKAFPEDYVAVWIKQAPKECVLIGGDFLFISLCDMKGAHTAFLLCWLRDRFTQYGMILTVTSGTVALLQKDSR